MADDDEKDMVLVRVAPFAALLFVLLEERLAPRLVLDELATRWKYEDRATNVELATFELDVVLTMDVAVEISEEEEVSEAELDALVSTVVLEVVP